MKNKVNMTNKICEMLVCHETSVSYFSHDVRQQYNKRYFYISVVVVILHYHDYEDIK